MPGKESLRQDNQLKAADRCPFCRGSRIVKSGRRKKKHEISQVYRCKHCQRKFTPGLTHHKTYPLTVILETLTAYNRLMSQEQAISKVGQKYGLTISPQNLSNWLRDFRNYLPFLRLRDFIAQKYRPQDCFIESKLFHGQIYDFGYHRAKLECLLNEEFRHYKFKSLRDFLELVVAECPHQIFKDNPWRASEYQDIFDLTGVKIVPKANAACQLARLAMQAVSNNKLRHRRLQEFMLVNDSVTVAVEVPVLLDQDDLFHYQNMLGFAVPLKLKEAEVLTGHIDFIQVRNGAIHLLDYKPSAHKAKPVGQLTLYALSLSRLTGIRLYHFKCAWFDEENYFEFFPLHVVYKRKPKKN